MVSSVEVTLYIKKAYEALAQSKANIDLNYYDVAISRAYYTMFYATMSLLSSQGLTPKKHSGVQTVFAQYFVKPGLIEPEYSKMLGNALRLRLDSDYEVAISFNQSMAEDVLDDARQFVKRAETHLQSEGYL